MSSPSRGAWQQWRDARMRAVTSVPGNLALISYQPVGQAPTPIEVVPSATVRHTDSLDGVMVSAPATAALGMEIDGTPITGDTFVARLRPDGTPVLRCGRYSFEAYTLDGMEYELRIYDKHAENLENFDGIDVYDYDESLVLEGTFTAYDAAEKVAWNFTRAADSGHIKRVPGTITANIRGTSHELLAFLDGEELVLVFADATTGSESYAPGRFLRMARPEAGPTVTVDFNRAFVPPCGFSDFYSCPVPPAQNKLPIPMRAGEQRVLWKKPRY